MLISEEYRALNARLHETNKDYGTVGAFHAPRVRQIAAGLGLREILDYGAGKCGLANALPHLKVDCYDPCIPELSAPPVPHDFVVCSDVLEHVEPELLDNVIDHLKELTLSYIYLALPNYPSSKTLEDGRNSHLTVEDWPFWLEKLVKRFDLCSLAVERQGVDKAGLDIQIFCFLMQAKGGPRVNMVPVPERITVGAGGAND